jgi:hypothetical protein
MSLYPTLVLLRNTVVLLIVTFGVFTTIDAKRSAPTATYAEVSPHYERKALKGVRS